MLNVLDTSVAVKCCLPVAETLVDPRGKGVTRRSLPWTQSAP